MEKQKDRFIVTLDGLLHESQVQKQFLVGEHLVQDLSKKSKTKTIEAISLENLHRIKKDPYSNLQNLSIGENPQHISHDLSQLPSTIGYIIDTSTRYLGQNVNKLKQIQELTKFKIIYGWTPNTDYISKQLELPENLETKLKNELEFDMKNGYHKMIPGFIGEIIINDMIQAYERVLLKIIYEFQISHNMCPIFINVGRNLNIIQELINFFSTTYGQNVVYNVSNFIKEDMTLDQNVQDILSKSQSIVQISLFNHFYNDIAPQDAIKESQNYKISRILPSLLHQYSDRILLSNGISFKTHLTTFGGPGYLQLFDKIISKISDQNLVKQVLYENPKRILTWREKDVEEIKVTPKWDCRWCQGKFEESHQKFEKMDFAYCSMKCLAAHRSKDYK